jgi:hypothetical protein
MSSESKDQTEAAISCRCLWPCQGLEILVVVKSVICAALAVDKRPIVCESATRKSEKQNNTGVFYLL